MKNVNPIFASMGKEELRAACREAGIGYGKLNNEGMRAALTAWREAFDAIEVKPASTAETVIESAEVKKEAEPVVAPTTEKRTSGTPTQAPVQKQGVTIEKNREERNGVKRPSAGGSCRAIWDALDEFQKTNTKVPTAQDVKLLAEANKWNANNASIELYQWRKFHGIRGRQPKA